MKFDTQVFYPERLEVARGVVGVDDLPVLSAEIDDLWNAESDVGPDESEAIVGVAAVTSLEGLVSATSILRGVMEDFEVPIGSKASVSIYSSHSGSRLEQPNQGTVLYVSPSEGLRLDVSLRGTSQEEAVRSLLELEVHPGDVVISSGMMFQRVRNDADDTARGIAFLFNK